MMRGRPTLLLLSCCLAGSMREDVAAGGAVTPAQAVTPACAAQPIVPGAAEHDAVPVESAPPEEALPGPYRGRLRAASTLNAACVSCHAQEAAEWARSRHRQSDTNAAYRRAFAVEPTSFCRGCHAPESDARREPPREVSELGVGCVTCHVTEEGAVLAAPASGGDEGAGDAYHRVRRSAAFAGSGGCAACHEFRFPGAHGDEDAVLMQTTVREHERSSSAAKACAACHMPRVEGRRSHAFDQSRDPAWLRDNLRATAERIEGGGVRVTLAQPAPGHGFPTGDLFRRLEVGCEVRGAGGEVIGREVRHLARHFEIVPGKPGRVLTGDDRVFDAPVVVEMAPGTGPLSWWVRYQRVATVGAGTRPADAVIESEVELHAGALP